MLLKFSDDAAATKRTSWAHCCWSTQACGLRLELARLLKHLLRAGELPLVLLPQHARLCMQPDSQDRRGAPRMHVCAGMLSKGASDQFHKVTGAEGMSPGMGRSSWLDVSTSTRCVCFVRPRRPKFLTCMTCTFTMHRVRQPTGVASTQSAANPMQSSASGDSPLPPKHAPTPLSLDHSHPTFPQLSGNGHSRRSRR